VKIVLCVMLLVSGSSAVAMETLDVTNPHSNLKRPVSPEKQDEKENLRARMVVYMTEYHEINSNFQSLPASSITLDHSKKEGTKFRWEQDDNYCG
jgi:hypothetical protein